MIHRTMSSPLCQISKTGENEIPLFATSCRSSGRSPTKQFRSCSLGVGIAFTCFWEKAGFLNVTVGDLAEVALQLAERRA